MVRRRDILRARAPARRNMAGRNYEMDMTEGPLLGKIVRFSIPVICMGLLQFLYSAADMIIAGKFAGSDALFTRKQYMIISFAPVVILGILIAVLTAAFYETAFWALYIIQILNLSGAAGDFYVGYLIARSGNDVLVRDLGTDMSFYSYRS